MSEAYFEAGEAPTKGWGDMLQAHLVTVYPQAVDNLFKSQGKSWGVDKLWPITRTTPSTR